MADLSKLSDEQLAVYRDMLAKRNPAPTPQSNTDKMISNIPSSAYRAVTHPTFPGMPVGGRDIQPGEHISDIVRKNVGDTWEGVKNFAQHPIDTIKNKFVDDPVGLGLALAAGARGAFPGTAEKIESGISGAGRAAMSQVRPTLDKFSLWHPLKNVGLAYDAAANTVKGAREAMSPPVTSPFDVRSVRTPPSSGGRPFSPQDTGIEGGVVEQPWKKALGIGDELPQQSKPVASTGGRIIEPHPTNIEGGVAPAKQLELDIKNPFEIKHERSMPSSGGYNPGIDKVREVGRGPSNLATVPNAATETRPVQSPTGASAQVPETPTNAPASFSSSYKPVSRKVIMDEQGKPVAYDDPQNPYNGPGTVKESEPEPDIHDQIAGEGIDKRAADSRAKYEDVYQNVIKGNYTADELRNMGPEEKTALDLKIKNMKHPEDHPSAGKKKYGTGLNPLVVDSLAKRLESEPQ